jgi:hypothetical protein
VRAGLTGLVLGLLALAYSWIWSRFDVFRLPGSAVGPNWVYVAWSAMLAMGFPLVTAGERRLGPLRSKQVVIFLLAASAFTFLWGHQYSHLAALSEGRGWGPLVSGVLEPLRRYAANWRTLIYPLGWSLTLALPLLLLLKLRRARAQLLAQALLPGLIALSLDVALRLYDAHRIGIEIQISIGTFFTAVPKGVSCAAYALAAAWSDQRALKACVQEP